MQAEPNAKRAGQPGKRATTPAGIQTLYFKMYFGLGLASVLMGLFIASAPGKLGSRSPDSELRVIGIILVTFGIVRMLLAVGKLRKQRAIRVPARTEQGI